MAKENVLEGFTSRVKNMYVGTHRALVEFGHGGDPESLPTEVAKGEDAFGGTGMWIQGKSCTQGSKVSVSIRRFTWQCLLFVFNGDLGSLY